MPIRILSPLPQRLYSKIFPPSLPSTHAPLIILHGGPGLPHDYLLNISPFISDRMVIYYDQLGCGRSLIVPLGASPTLSIEESVRDLYELLTYLNIDSCSLLGHSWGGILAYEFSLFSSKLFNNKVNILSLILCDVPTSIALVKRKINECMGRLIMEGVRSEDLDTVFRRRHTCHDINCPNLILSEAHRSTCKQWSGLETIRDWTLPPDSVMNNETEGHVLRRILVLRGCDDFVDFECVYGWRSVAADVRFETVANSSHMPHIENSKQFMELINEFLAEDTV